MPESNKESLGDQGTATAEGLVSEADAGQQGGALDGGLEFATKPVSEPKIGKSGRELYVRLQIKFPKLLLDAVSLAAENEGLDIASWLRQLASRQLRGELILVPRSRRVSIHVYPDGPKP